MIQYRVNDVIIHAWINNTWITNHCITDACITLTNNKKTPKGLTIMSNCSFKKQEGVIVGTWDSCKGQWWKYTQSVREVIFSLVVETYLSWKSIFHK